MQIIRRRPAAQVTTQESAPLQKPYLMLQAWNLFMRAPRMLTVERAREEEAPEDAIYKGNEGRWVCKGCLDFIPSHPFHKYSADFIAKNSAPV